MPLRPRLRRSSPAPRTPRPKGQAIAGRSPRCSNSLPGGGTKARPSVIEDKPTSEKPEPGKPGSAEPRSHPPDGAAFGSLPPYSIPLAITAVERLAGTDSLRGRAPASGIEPELPDDAPSNRASADLANFGAPARLVGERTFLSSLSPPRGALAELSVSGEPPEGEARVPVASRGPRTPASACSRAAPAPPPHDPARKSLQPETLASQPTAGNDDPARNSASSKPVEPTDAARALRLRRIPSASLGRPRHCRGRSVSTLRGLCVPDRCPRLKLRQHQPPTPPRAPAPSSARSRRSASRSRKSTSTSLRAASRRFP